MMTVEAYIQSEWTAERRHEFINGTLFEMPGEKDINNKLAFLIAMMLYKQLGKGYEVFTHDIKVAIPGANKFYYPDVFATAELPVQSNQYVKHEPVIIVEVVSPGSHKHDYVDKYIDYTQISSLRYYLIAEPETLLVTVHEREGEEWSTGKYTRLDEIVQLPQLSVSLPMADIYESIRS